MTFLATYLDTIVGSERTLVADAIRELVPGALSPRMFGAVGDGTTDDTAALTLFWNSAIANPGVQHLLDSLRYKITAALPVINVSNVWIEGAGATMHDAGPVLAGSVLVWGGATGAASAVTVSSVNGAVQYVSGVILRGFGIDCNSGAAGYGLTIKSVRHCDIDVAVANAGILGVLCDTVATLSESADVQSNRFRFKLRQVEAPGVACLALRSTIGANTSMNEIWVDARIHNAPAIVCENSDNNDWRSVRCTSSGSATEGVSLLGGATEPLSSRAERFDFYTGNVPIHAYGTTSGSPTYAVGSNNHQIFVLDSANGTPAPIVEGGASIHWRNDKSALADDAWIAFTPTIAAQAGTLTTVAGQSGVYRKFGKRVEFRLFFSITTNGTGSGYLTATLPFAAAGTLGSDCVGKERTLTGKLMSGYIDGATNYVLLQYYDGTYPGASGATYSVSGEFEVAS